MALSPKPENRFYVNKKSYWQTDNLSISRILKMRCKNWCSPFQTKYSQVTEADICVTLVKNID